MKKFRLWFLILLLISLVFPLIGCTLEPDENGGTGDPVIAQNLKAPENLKISSTTNYYLLSYDPVENVSMYKIIIRNVKGEAVKTVKLDSSSTEYAIKKSDLKETEYNIFVVALGDGEKFYNSEESKSVNLKISLQKLSKPTNVTITDSNTNVVVSYDVVQNASYHRVVIKNTFGVIVKELTLGGNVTSCTIKKSSLENGTYDVTVVALGDGKNYSDSDSSESVSLTIENGGDDPIILSDYYKEASNLKGLELKKSLRSIITKTHKKITSYADCKKYLQNADEDPNNSNNMLLFYTGESIKKTDNMNIWNREHVWAQSLGWFKTSGAGADLHHIRPCDPGVNGSRGNKKFGTASGYYTPKDSYKGDVARIIFYLMTRYSESDSYNWTSIAQSLDLLLAWHELDPVDTHESNRNDYIAKIQGNRNPYIDYPEFAAKIWA